MTPKTQTMPLLDIESALLDDTSGETRRKYTERLYELRRLMQLQLRAMNDRNTYRQTTAALDAIDGAITVLRTTRSPAAPARENPQRALFSISTFLK